MYKVFLVDDEIVIREGIRNSFPWDALGFVLCGEAPDGEIALPMMQDLKPDILVTDIRMPFMDGLALCRQVARAMPWVHIVILSGHDDFAYAREAISLGVKEYLLKPVTAHQMEEVLTRIALAIEDERAQQADVDALRRQLASSTRFARKALMDRLLAGEDADALLSEAARLRMPLAAASYLVLLLDVGPQGDALALEGIAQRLAEGSGGLVWPARSGENLALVVLGEGRDDIEERAYGLAQALEHEAARSGLPAPSVAIGAPVDTPAALPQALTSARAVLRSMRGQPRRIVGSMDVDVLELPALIDGDILPLHEKLRYAAQQDAEQVVDEYFDAIGDMARKSLLVMHYMLMDILIAASRVVRQYGGDPARVLPAELVQQEAAMALSQQPEAAVEAGKRAVRAALAFRDENTFSRYGETLRKACAYIEENHHRPEITLHDVASHVALSNNHFCTVFSQEMGATFTEYLTATRMDKAKRLIATTQMRTSDVAYAVGYNDPHYFSYLFKKHAGVSPREFRKEEKGG